MRQVGLKIAVFWVFGFVCLASGGVSLALRGSGFSALNYVIGTCWRCQKPRLEIPGGHFLVISSWGVPILRTMGVMPIYEVGTYWGRGGRGLWGAWEPTIQHRCSELPEVPTGRKHVLN